MEPENLKDTIARLISEEILIVPYDDRWRLFFQQEAEYLRSTLPSNIIKRIEHFGSTAIPGLPSKPIIDILVEVSSLEEVKHSIAPLLESTGYEYLWRPEFDDISSRFYAWFIKRNSQGKRTHHIHMVEANSTLWERLLFRDYLRTHPEDTNQYAELKRQLASEFQNDRIGYTAAKTTFIQSIMDKARHHYAKT
ncbi:MAG: GrpB family protein [bacterium]